MTLPPLVAAVDDLYRDVVLDPEPWSDHTFAEWIESIGGADPPTRGEVRELRRALRVAVKLARFWSSPTAPAGEADWERRVDIALGPAAWRPSLQLATMALDGDPSPELFDHVAARFRLVNNAPFAGGSRYEEWLAESDPP